MSTTVSTPAYRPRFSADSALKGAAAFWFAVAVTGQVIFATSTAMLYGLTALRGDVHAWNKHLAQGITAGDTIGNTALIAHLISAVFIILSGALQFSPLVRRRWPRVHRWNGRMYMVTAFSVSLAGMYLLAFRPPATSLAQRAGTFLLGAIIMFCAAMAWRYAMKRQFAAHRRWALRLFLVVGAALFIRSAIALISMILAGTGQFDVTVIQGSVLTFVSYAQFCVPLAVLELYFWTQTRGGTRARLAMAAALVAITLLMGMGIAAASVALFVPNIRASVDPRLSIADTLAATIKSSGVDAAEAQYHHLAATAPGIYNFDETELNSLGYELLRSHQYPQAIRILQLNTEIYPKSGNTWDSLGEAYMDAGNIPLAVANYHKSLAINPANNNAVLMLAKMNAH